MVRAVAAKLEASQAIAARYLILKGTKSEITRWGDASRSYFKKEIGNTGSGLEDLEFSTIYVDPK